MAPGRSSAEKKADVVASPGGDTPHTGFVTRRYFEGCPCMSKIGTIWDFRGFTGSRVPCVFLSGRLGSWNRGVSGGVGDLDLRSVNSRLCSAPRITLSPFLIPRCCSFFSSAHRPFGNRPCRSHGVLSRPLRSASRPPCFLRRPTTPEAPPLPVAPRRSGERWVLHHCDRPASASHLAVPFRFAESALNFWRPFSAAHRRRHRGGVPAVLCARLLQVY